MPELPHPVCGGAGPGEEEASWSNTSTQGFGCCQLPACGAESRTHLPRPTTCAHLGPRGAAC